MKTRSQIGLEESTRDPIFLFQGKVYLFAQTQSGCEYDAERECWVDDDTGDELEESEVIEAGLDQGSIFETWETELVFATREEGERYGKNRAYNYPNGWRVYCVCAESSLIDILNKGME